MDWNYYGEKIDNIEQIELRTFNGEELKKYVEHCIFLNKQNNSTTFKQSISEYFKQIDKRIKIMTRFYFGLLWICIVFIIYMIFK